MYYEEKFIDGILVYRTHPRGHWIEASIEKLNAKLAELQQERDELKASIERLLPISRLLHTQDNRITDQPFFIVQKKVREYGYDSEYADHYNWIDGDASEIEDDAAEIERLEALEERCESTSPWYKCYYKEDWHFVMGCFTEQGCKDYLARNGHNHRTETRIYADGSFRNNEYQEVRNFLLSLTDPTTLRGQEGSSND